MREKIIFYSEGLKMKENLGLYCLCLVREFGSVTQNENGLFPCKIARRIFAPWHLQIYQMRFSIDPSGRDECPTRINEPPL